MLDMKDSGIVDIGFIPKDYVVSRIKYIAEIYGRIGFRGYTQQDLVDEGEGPITLSPSNFKDMKMNYDKCSYLTWEKYNESPEIMINEGDILFVKTGSSYGKNCYVTDMPMECTINPQLIVFKNISGNAKWFSYFLQTQHISNLSELAVVGGTIPTMSQEKIGNFTVIVPPLEKQNAIVKALDQKCEEIDALHESIQKELDILDEYKKSIITEKVTKGLDKKRGMKDSGTEWLGMIPEHWEVSRIGSIYSLRNTKVSDKDYEPLSVTMSGVVPQLESAAKTNAHDDRKLVKKGDFCINSRSDRRGSCGISPSDGSVSLINTILAPMGEMNPRYYNWLFHTVQFADEFYKWGHGIVADLWTTGWQEMKKILIPSPSLEEQEEIANYLDIKCSEIDSIMSSKQEQLAVLEEYKRSVIFEYVTGKVEVG